MKDNYEHRHRHFLTRRIPVIIRIDGNCFHSFCKGMQKPFDDDFIHAMAETGRQMFSQLAGAKLCYVQSDEISFFLTDYDTLQTEPWFGYNKSKLESISAV